MKKLLLSAAAIALAGVSVNAQTRLALYEEFSGENCGPCAAANPGLWTLAQGNTAKMLLIKYQSPIPSAGPIYNLYPTDYQNRGPYYTVPFAPYGRLDGKVLGTGSNPGHVSYLTQTEINNEAAIAAPFNISVTHAWNAAGDQITINVNVTAVSASSGTYKLRAALLETLIYDSPPGTNGETEFHNVVRRMYPDGNGTTMATAWTASQTQTYTLTGAVPSYIDKADAHTFVVVWIQNDADKIVAQTATSTPVAPPLDVASDGLSIPQTLYCTSSNASVTPTVAVKNTGTTTLTSAVIYYQVDGGAWQSQNWTGSLVGGASASVALPAQSLAAGRHVIKDSLAKPNNLNDVNIVNNTGTKQVYVQNTTQNALPLTTSYENGGGMPTNFMLYDANVNGQNWEVYNSGKTGTYSIRHRNYEYPDAEANYAVLPTPNMPAGAKALDFYVAHAPYSANYSDKLDVVYSTNCGQSWTSVWSKGTTDLATAAATTSPYVPTSTQWKKVSVDVSNIPTGAMVALKATSNYGNNMYVDDINLRTGATTGISEVIANSKVELYPNPARESVSVGFTLNESADVQVLVLDAAGRTVVAQNNNLTAGAQKVNLNVANLASGIYTIKIQTEKGSQVERLSIVK